MSEEKYWLDAMQPVSESEAVSYFHRKGIYAVPSCIKFTENMIYSKGKTKQVAKAICFVTRNQFGETCERISIMKIGDEYKKKTQILRDEPASVQLKQHNGSLAISTTIESALSVMQKFSVSCWASLTSENMSKFIVPNGISNLFIYAENSPAGLAAAMAAAEENLKSSNNVIKACVKWTKSKGDFHDYLFEPSTIFEHEF